MRQCPVVYLTEERDASFSAALRRASLDNADDLYILAASDTAGLEWPDIVERAVRFVEQIGAGLLIVDTLAQFVRVVGDAENLAGDALEALAPLQAAAARGLAVIVARHERKAGGDVGDSGRGSSAFAGAVDIVLAFRREAAGDGRVRVLHGISRFDGVPESLAVERGDDGTYRALGDGTALQSRRARAHILDVLPVNPDNAIRLKDVPIPKGLSKSTIERTARALAEEGVLGKRGRGVSGDPHRFWAPKSGHITPDSKGDETDTDARTGVGDDEEVETWTRYSC